jgi:hypothetical protein
MKSWQEGCYVIYRVWSLPTTVKSDFARKCAETIAWAASRGYVTTEIAPYTKDYGNIFKVTPKGLLFLWEALDGLDREGILGIIANEQFEDEAFWEHD